MSPDKPLWKQAAESRTAVNLLLLACLGVVAYLLFRHAGALNPAEGAVLIVATTGLLWTGLAWWDWHRGLAQEGPLLDWVEQIRRGDRRSLQPPEGLRGRDRQVVEALNAVIGDAQKGQADLAALRQTVVREWWDLDALLEAIQQHHAVAVTTRVQSGARLESLGQELKTILEDTLGLDQIELNHRLRADQHRFQGQAFQATLDQVRSGLDQYENLLEELRDSFPRLRREEDSLGLLAVAGLRQGARLGLVVTGLVAHTPKLVDETQARPLPEPRVSQKPQGLLLPSQPGEGIAQLLQQVLELIQS